MSRTKVSEKMDGFELIVTDRVDGSECRISGHSSLAVEHVQNAADFNNIDVNELIRMMKSGQGVQTFGFYRRLVPIEKE